MNSDDIVNLAKSRGLHLKEDIRFNEMGIDFKVAFASDLNDQKWVLRIPRREGLEHQIQKEEKILKLVRKHLSVSVPDWKIVDSSFIAYPLLENSPVITFDSTTHEILWGIDKKNEIFTPSLAKIILELHQFPAFEASEMGLKCLTIEQVRQDLIDDIEYVKREIGIRAELENRWRRWADTDDYWPHFISFVHGDLYAGHLLADTAGNVSGIIDWSEAQFSDPSIDFTGHLAVFGEQGLRDLISSYEKAGGRVWKMIIEHTHERQSAAPLKYATFALRADLDEHIIAARTQLGAI